MSTTYRVYYLDMLPRHAPSTCSLDMLREAAEQTGIPAIQLLLRLLLPDGRSPRTTEKPTESLRRQEAQDPPGQPEGQGKATESHSRGKEDHEEGRAVNRPLAPGPYNESISFVTNDPDEPSHVIPITAEIVERLIIDNGDPEFRLGAGSDFRHLRHDTRYFECGSCNGRTPHNECTQQFAVL